MGQIHLLPPEVVNRIAAGEVIERPASVVKELAENAIDAGASEIFVEVEEGGRKRIRVRDTGSGMTGEDLVLAFKSHSTSKLGGGLSGNQGHDRGGKPHFDLFHITSLGFRGEALASIASVSEVEAISRCPGAECAQCYRLRAGVADELRPVAAASGTSIEIRNLFFNTPARRKFLRSNSTELSHIVDQVVRLALGFPGIRFLLTSGGKRVLECPATSSFRERLGAVLGRQRAQELIEVRETEGGPQGIRVRGFIGPPHLHRQDVKGQHFFVDGRWVRDRVVGHALMEAFKGFQIPGQKPLAYLFIQIPEGELDVNVHPTKCEVRFVDSGAVHRATHGAVRDALLRTGDPQAAKSGEPGLQNRLREATLDFMRSPPPAAPAAWGKPPGGQGRNVTFRTRAEETAVAGQEERPRVTPFSRGHPQQILGRYLLVEVEGGVVFYDQHALHEKILYEKILEGLGQGKMPRQRLLVPEVVELPLDLVPVIPELSARLEPLGFELEQFGPREVAVHAVPSVLGQMALEPMLLEVSRYLKDGGKELEDRSAVEGDVPVSRAGNPLGSELVRLAQMVACKKAIKAGMPLKTEEIQELLGSADTALDPRFCPHGRPTSIFISREEIDRRFQRK